MAEYVYRNFDEICGVAFLPADGGSYRQAPFQEVDEETYLDLKEKMPEIDWDRLKDYEIEDTTDNAKELACVGNACAI
jgi:ribonucleoside-diphosphate reductase alpha chain